MDVLLVTPLTIPHPSSHSNLLILLSLQCYQSLLKTSTYMSRCSCFSDRHCCHDDIVKGCTSATLIWITNQSTVKLAWMWSYWLPLTIPHWTSHPNSLTVLPWQHHNFILKVLGRSPRFLLVPKELSDSAIHAVNRHGWDKKSKLIDIVCRDIDWHHSILKNHSLSEWTIIVVSFIPWMLSYL